MKPGWKNRIDERRYFDEMRERQRAQALNRMHVRAQIEQIKLLAIRELNTLKEVQS